MIGEAESEVSHFYSLRNAISWRNGTAYFDTMAVGEPGLTYRMLLKY